MLFTLMQVIEVLAVIRGVLEAQMKQRAAPMPPTWTHFLPYKPK